MKYNNTLCTCAEQIKNALETISLYGSSDGACHKQWVLDQVVRILAANQYTQWVTNNCNGENGPNTYEWDEGIPP